MAMSFHSLAVVASLSILTASCSLADAKPASQVPQPALDLPAGPGLQTAVLAGGCFWGVEGVFERVRGVRSAVSGFAGGSQADASYDKIGNGRTGHAEVVRIVYDPRLVSYGTLLRIHFSVVHDPTQLNRQGPDTGPQYRSAIFPQNPAQSRVARAYLAQLEKAGVFPKRLATRIESGAFYPAEAYHQDFMRKNPRHPYILAHDRPKVAALKRDFPRLFRA